MLIYILDNINVYIIIAPNEFRYITKKKFNNKNYYYIVENKLINKKPVMKHIKYLGTAEKILETFKKLGKKN